MDSVFRLLIYAIASAVLIALVYTIMFPLVFPGTDNSMLIENNLKTAEIGLGLGFKSDLVAKEGEGFSGQSFDTRLRNVAFICNSAELCCPQGQKCGLAIEWDNRLIKFKKSAVVPTTARCSYELGLFACNIYLGESPAQIEIKSVEVEKQIDLEKKTATIQVEFENSGSQRTEQTGVGIEIFQKYLEDGEWKDGLIQSASKTETFGVLEPGKKMSKIIALNIEENGEFRADIKAFGSDAGYSEKTVNFTTAGAGNQCSYSSYEAPMNSGEKCIVKTQCTNCTFGNECKDKVIEAASSVPTLNNYITHGNVSYEILGSNLVEFSVSLGYCP